jgi:hypothetical protein
MDHRGSSCVCKSSFIFAALETILFVSYTYARED